MARKDDQRIRQDRVETDPRFPSGPWKGFWLQRLYRGRQWMRGLWLRFVDGQVEGGGSDCVGPFTFKGRYDLKTGQCLMTKQYLGGHLVQYDGVNQDDGLWLWGVWSIREQDSGGFHLWPHGVEDPTLKKKHAEVEAPREEAVGVASTAGADV